jgi:hypothetical protein
MSISLIQFPLLISTVLESKHGRHDRKKHCSIPTLWSNHFIRNCYAITAYTNSVLLPWLFFYRIINSSFLYVMYIIKTEWMKIEINRVLYMYKISWMYIYITIKKVLHSWTIRLFQETIPLHHSTSHAPLCCKVDY